MISSDPVLLVLVMAVLLVPLFWAAMAACVLVSLLLTCGDLRLLTAELRGKTAPPPPSTGRGRVLTCGDLRLLTAELRGKTALNRRPRGGGRV